MVPRKGEKNGKAWSGFFCSTPKGTPNQCAPIFEKSYGGGFSGSKPATAPYTASQTPSNEALMVEILKEVKAIKALVGTLVNDKEVPGPVPVENMWK